MATRKKPLTAKQKAKAWRWAARLVQHAALYYGWDQPAYFAEHALDAIVPSLRRRADIIERNGKR